MCVYTPYGFSSFYKEENLKIDMEKKIADIKNELESADISNIDDVLNQYREDARSGVVKLIAKYDREKEKLVKERERSYEMRNYERQYGEEFHAICGIDEVGRGPLAGPVVACAVILPTDEEILYLNDSKQVSEKKREELYDVIMEKAVSVGIGVVPPSVIDDINILQATYEAMRIAISKLEVKPDLLLNDAVTIPGVELKQVPIIKGDAKSASIAAASIVAKVTRDRMMVDYDTLFPGYGFASNKGYGSSEHIKTLKEVGPTPIHRRTFIGNFINEE